MILNHFPGIPSTKQKDKNYQFWVEMGQNSSTSRSTRRKSMRDAVSSLLARYARSRQENLSAAFNVLSSSPRADRVNVNIACEEELMTLPNLSYEVAHNIVEYRRQIGRFNKVEDLALVSGIGADRLDQIRPGICVNSRPSFSSSNSDSTSSSVHSNLPINVNTATVFELQTLSGLSQEIAANIVNYRKKHGNFSSINQLTKIKGINRARLGMVNSRLSVKSQTNTSIKQNGFSHNAPSAKKKLKDTDTVDAQTVDTNTIPDDQSRIPVKRLSGGSNGVTIYDLMDLLSACSQRPIIEEHFDGKRNGRPAIRLATWNLGGLTCEKANNTGVLEVVCCTILENRFSFLALQEVTDSPALKIICDELNSPSLRRIKGWKSNSCCWESRVCNGLGFLWDAKENISLIDMKEADKSLHFGIVADFKFVDATATFLNLHLDNSFDEEIEVIEQMTKDIASKLLIILGDFSALHATEIEANRKYLDDYQPVLPYNTDTCSILPDDDKNESKCFDTVLLSNAALRLYTDMAGVVRDGLNHFAIPRCWSWYGPASDHCPVWCEMYTA